MAMSRTARRVLSLGGATAGSQAIALAALPVITRLYPPEILGLLATALSVMTMVSVIACLRYDQAIPLVISRSGSSALVLLSLLLAGATALLSAGVLYSVFHHFDDRFRKTPKSEVGSPWPEAKTRPLPASAVFSIGFTGNDFHDGRRAGARPSVRQLFRASTGGAAIYCTSNHAFASYINL